MPRRKKIVYILGAGFSKSAGIPEQKNILPEILNQAPNPLFKKLLISLYNHVDNIPLEDIFTAIDKSIIGNETLHRIDKKDLLKIKDDFTIAIKNLFIRRFYESSNDYINKFAELILRHRIKEIDKDTIAIISTNWDTLLEDALKQQMLKDWAKKENERIAFIDYCTFTHSLDPSEKIPSIRLRALGYANLKLLKLHGSIGWHICPSCSSLFIDSKISGKLYNPDIGGCKICEHNLLSNIKTKPLIIFPTFLKDFNNVHFRNIWWNSGFELSEATHIVFIGYSLPLSDYELRYLFARSIRKAKIKVILFSKDPVTDEDYKATKKRYVDFFGSIKNPDENIKYYGVEEYVNRLNSGEENFYW